MAKFRRFKNNVCANGVYLIFIPFAVSILLTAVFVAMGDTTGIGGYIVYEPDNYKEMSIAERTIFLNEQFGGSPTKEWHWGFKLSFPDFAGRWYMVFPDGTEMELDDYYSFLKGSGVEVDYYNVVISILSLNPPALEHIGLFGLLIRILMIVSVCIGFVELIWIG